MSERQRRKNEAINTASDLIISGKASYDVSSIPSEVLEASIKKIEDFGTPLGMRKLYEQLHQENMNRNVNPGIRTKRR